MEAAAAGEAGFQGNGVGWTGGLYGWANLMDCARGSMAEYQGIRGEAKALMPPWR